jgi:translation initiation factor IF-2
MEKHRITPQEKLNKYLDLYLKEKRNNQDEFEIRFGTNENNTMTKISFENIISKLKSLGFRSENLDGDTYLNITNEYADSKTGRM